MGPDALEALWLALALAASGLGPAALIRRGTRRQLTRYARSLGLDGAVEARQGWLHVGGRLGGRDVWLRLHSGGGVRYGLDLDDPQLRRVSLAPREEGPARPFPDPDLDARYVVRGPFGPQLALLTPALRAALIEVSADGPARPRLEGGAFFLELPGRAEAVRAAHPRLQRLLPALPAGPVRLPDDVLARLEDPDELEPVRSAALRWLLARPDEAARARAAAAAEASGVPALRDVARFGAPAAQGQGRLSLAEDDGAGRLSEAD